MESETQINQVKTYIASPQFYSTLENTSEKFGLHTDQMGELYAEVCDVLKGVSKSSDFTDHVMERLEISRDLANKIAIEINTSIFNVLKDGMQAQTMASTPPVDSFEAIGGISIEKPTPESENKNVTSADRVNILAGLENPPAATRAHTNVPPTNLPTDEEAGPFSEQKKTLETHTEPLVDYLLNNPAARPVSNVTPTPPTAVQKKAPVVPPKPAGGPDPYREAIK